MYNFFYRRHWFNEYFMFSSFRQIFIVISMTTTIMTISYLQIYIGDYAFTSPVLRLKFI